MREKKSTITQSPLVIEKVPDEFVVSAFCEYVVKIGVHKDLRDWHVLIVENFVKSFLPSHGFSIYRSTRLQDGDEFSGIAEINPRG